LGTPAFLVGLLQLYLQFFFYLNLDQQF